MSKAAKSPQHTKSPLNIAPQSQPQPQPPPPPHHAPTPSTPSKRQHASPQAPASAGPGGMSSEGPSGSASGSGTGSGVGAAAPEEAGAAGSLMQPPAKKSRTNTPWTAAEEQRLKTMREAGNSWADIAKTFPKRTEGSVKKHWYKDMHYAEFAEDESQALLNAIKEYETNKWKVIGLKVGKPAKACEQYAKEHFGPKP